MDAEHQAVEPGCGEVSAKAAAALASVPLRAWVLVKLWLWFVVPLGLPAIGLWHAMGLGSLLGLLTYSVQDMREAKTPMTWAELVSWCWVFPTFCLGTAAVYRWLAF